MGNLFEVVYQLIYTQKWKTPFSEVKHQVSQGDQVVSAAQCLLLHGIFAAKSNISTKMYRFGLDVSAIILQKIGAETKVNESNFI